MNILINFLYKEGAGPVFSLEMARGFAKNGCNVYAVVSSKISNRGDWEKETLLKSVCFIDTGNRRTALNSTAKFLIYKHREVRHYFNGIQFDYIVQTFYHPWAEFINKQVSYSKVVTICHDPILHSGVKKSEIFLTRRFVKNSDEIVVLTKSFISVVHENYGIGYDNIHYMPHGRMSDYRNNQIKDIDTLYDENKINFLFFGRISEYKGLNILEKAFSRLERQNPNVSLTVAGSGDFGPYEEKYSKLKNINVFNKYIPDNEVGKYFDNDTVILILPYLDATQSGVIPIAFEYGVPVIASDSGGLKEQLNQGKVGFFVEPGNADALYEKMRFVCENPVLVNNERMNMKKTLNSLEWDRVTNKLLESLENKKSLK